MFRVYQDSQSKDNNEFKTLLLKIFSLKQKTASCRFRINICNQVDKGLQLGHVKQNTFR